jgi:hypothetical protein
MTENVMPLAAYFADMRLRSDYIAVLALHVALKASVLDW